MEEYEQQRGKGSFPAHFTPGYQTAKKANEMASKVSSSLVDSIYILVIFRNRWY